ncbi:MAG: hybrid sensor histidine kinase/response regulator, partial [Candidatus Kapaibacteriota bacterium]
MRNDNLKADLKNAKILIVDDLPENIKVLGSILKNEGFNVAVANDGNMAIKIATNIIPDLLLLDIMMPNMNGFELATLLSENEKTKNIPVIFITAKNETVDILEGFRLGAVDYITKPFNPAELIVRVYNHLELKFSKDIISKQKEELALLNKSKDKFFSIISHDLRSPFSGFLGLTELLDQDFESFEKEEIKTLSKNMNFAAKDLYALLENLLEWSRSQMNNISFNPEKINILDIINNLSNLFEQTLNNKSLNLIINKPQKDEEVFVFADSYMVNSIIRNLISNAIKFSPKGNNIEVIIENLNTNFTNIYIKDYGVGISKQNIDSLFKIDSKYVTKGTENEKGTGLGLLL